MSPRLPFLTTWRSWAGRQGAGAHQLTGPWRGRARHLDAEVRALDEVKEELRQLTERLGETFLELGHALMVQSELSQELVSSSQCIASASQPVDGKSWALDQAGALVSAVMAYVGESRAEIAALVERLAGFRAQIEHLKQSEGDGRQIISPLRTIEVLFRIEIARMEPEQQSVFATVTEEIRRLQQEVQSVFATHATTLERTEQCLGQTGSKLLEHATAMTQAVTSIEVAVHAAQAALQQAAATQLEANQQLTGLADAVRADTDSIIVALQYQDITRQKIEHINAAADDLQAKQNEAALPPAERAADVALLGRVAEAQVESLEADLQTTFDRLQAGVVQLHQRLGALGDQCAARSTTQDVTKAMDALIAALLDGLRQVRPLIDQAGANTADAFNAIQQLQSAAAGVTGTMHTLAADIRFLAVNAQVQAARVQQLSGLEVLSTQTCAVARETETFSQANSDAFAAVLAQLPDVVERCHQLQRRTREGGEELSGRGADVERQLETYRTTVTDALTRMSGAVEQSRRSPLAGGSLGDVATAAQATTNRARQILLRIQTAARAVAGPRASAGPVEGLAARYTMDSERQAHQAALQAVDTGRAPAPVRPAATLTPAPAVPALTAAPGAMGDNVELF